MTPLHELIEYPIFAPILSPYEVSVSYLHVNVT